MARLQTAALLLMCLAALANFSYLLARISADEQLRGSAPFGLLSSKQSQPPQPPPPQQQPQWHPQQQTFQCENWTMPRGMSTCRSVLPESAARLDCDVQYGWGLVRSLRSKRQTVCDGAAPATSRVECFVHHGRHSSKPQSAYCDMEHVALVGRHMVAGQKSGLAGEEGHLTHHPGALVFAGCPGGANRLRHVAFAEPYSELFRSVVDETRNAEQQQSSLKCDEWIEQPVVALTRNEWAHLLFSASEAMNAMIGMHVAGIDLAKARILLLDTHPGGPFEGFFEALSPGNGGVLHAKELLVDKKRTVCFRRLVTSVPGYSSFLIDQAQGAGTACRSSELLLSFRNTVLSYYNLLDKVKNDGGNKLGITFVSRKPYHHEGFNKKVIGRVVTNEDDLVAAMQPFSGRVHFAIADLATMSLAQQLQAVRSTTLLVGMHGAGLVHSIFLADDAALLEIWPGGAQENHRDRNIALLAGHIYLSYELKSHETERIRLDTEQFISNIDDAIHIAHGSFGTSISRCGLRC